MQHNGKGGIYASESERNVIEDNTLKDDPLQLLLGSHRHVVRGNTITGAGTDISIEGEENTITENVVSGAEAEGFLAEGPRNAFTCNRVVDNPVGFRFTVGAAANSVNENVIEGNSVGLDASGLEPADPAIEASQNWWGCVGGPGFFGCAPVAGKVDASSPAAQEPACVPCPAGSDCYDHDDYKCWKVKDLRNLKFEGSGIPALTLMTSSGWPPTWM